VKSSRIYSPAWWLPGGHLQTIWGKLARDRRDLPLTREIWTTPDDDEIEIYHLAGTEGRPHLLLLHGLEGTVRSHYVNGFFSEASDLGWSAHLLVFRSCGDHVNKTCRLYHSGETGDVRFALDRLRPVIGDSQIFLAGVSLGGNVLLKFLGESGSALPAGVAAAAAVSVPYDLASSATRISKGFSRIYQRFFLRTLKLKMIAKRQRFDDLPSVDVLENIRTLKQFDDVVTAPIHGFQNAMDYYTRSSSLQYLTSIRLPTLLLSSFDDPFLPPEILAKVELVARSNPALHVEFLRHGGHVGFIGGAVPWRPTYYAEHHVMKFFDAYANRAASTDQGEVA